MHNDLWIGDYLKTTYKLIPKLHQSTCWKHRHIYPWWNSWIHFKL